MLRVAFVDDEPNILSGLKRILRSMRGAWDMAFYPDGEAALRGMAEHEFDVVITDMRMPGMNGAELLKEVHRLYPGTIRIIMSGYCGRELTLQAVQVAHQFLAKPCSPETIHALVNRFMQMRKLLSCDGIQKRILGIQALPTRPEIFREFAAEAGGQGATVESVAAIVESDIGLTTKLFQITNSAFFGLPVELTTAHETVHELGLDTIRALVETGGVFAPREIGDLGPMDAEWHMANGQRAAAIAGRIGERLGLDDRTRRRAVLGAKLHDIGLLVGIVCFRQEIEAALKLSQESCRPLHVVEWERNGDDHGVIGAYLLGLWGLPNSIVEAIAFHHVPALRGEYKLDEVALVHLAAGLGCAHGTGADSGWQGAVDMELVRALGIERELGEIAAEALVTA